MKLIAATKNQGKLRELKEILGSLGYDVVSADEMGYNDDVEETGVTFEENAILKAHAIYDVFHLPTIADDSGLIIDALNGEPGVYSARYAKPGERCNKVLSKLEGVPDEKRTAKFVCSICFIDENGKETIAFGECKGKIGYKKIGDNGFGYDPIFVYGDKTLAQMTDDEKNDISHRGRAIENLLKQINGGNSDK